MTEQAKTLTVSNPVEAVVSSELTKLENTMNSLKLYVWEDCLTDYTDGIMFALAASEEDAREQILKSCNYVPPAELAVQPKVVDSPVGYAIWGGS